MAKGLTGNAVAYIRVSTGKQTKSGLGLEAQIEAIRAFAKRLGAAHPPDDISGRVEVRRGAGLRPSHLTTPPRCWPAPTGHVGGGWR